MQKLFFVDDTTIVFFQFVKDGIDFTNCAHTYDSVVVKGKFKTFNSNVEVFIDDKMIYDFISLYVNATPACYEKFFKISGKYQIVSDGLIKWEKRLVKRLKYYKFGYGDRKKSARMIKCENQNQVMRIMTFAYLLFDQVTFKNKL
ncbi:MAG: hypothetical protein KKD31_09430 [Bacteroidetes bacterium]|nr:hypothetical protein [Bacteroidota bacterium]